MVSPPITSLRNPTIRRIVKLRQRSQRDRQGLVLIEGCRELSRAVECGHIPTHVLYCLALARSAQHDEVLCRCRDAGAEILECTQPVFRKASYRDNPDGILAIAPPVGTTLAGLPHPNGSLIAVAEAVEKPGNLGMILRSADAAGVSAVVACDPVTDLNNPNVVRASMGALFCVPVARAGAEETVLWLKNNGVCIVATSPRAETIYTDADLSGNVAVVVGAEHRGLSSTWLEGANVVVRIPMLGLSDSLNAAAAATLLFFESVRQRGLGREPLEGDLERR